MAKSGRKKQPSDPLLVSVEIHLRQVVSCATAALRTLSLAKGNFTALSQGAAGSQSFSQLTDSQVVTRNLLEAVQLVDTKARATVATATRALISTQESHESGRAAHLGATETKGPSARTIRRKNFRELRKVNQSDKSDLEPTDAPSSCVKTPSKKHSSDSLATPRESPSKSKEEPETPAITSSLVDLGPVSTGKKRAKGSTGDKGTRRNPKAKRLFSWTKGKRSESAPAVDKQITESLQRSTSQSPEGRSMFHVYDR